MFNNLIGDLQLREIFISGVKFKWSNKQHHPTLIKLDRILVSSCWDVHYSGCFAWSKARVSSDHSPLLLDTGEKRENKSKYFYFQENGFRERSLCPWLGINGI